MFLLNAVWGVSVYSDHILCCWIQPNFSIGHMSSAHRLPCLHPMQILPLPASGHLCFDAHFFYYHVTCYKMPLMRCRINWMISNTVQLSFMSSSRTLLWFLCRVYESPTFQLIFPSSLSPLTVSFLPAHPRVTTNSFPVCTFAFYAQIIITQHVPSWSSFHLV